MRFTKNDTELYCPTANGEDEWIMIPHLNEIRFGLGNAVWYDDISESEAKQWMEKLKKEE